MAEALTVFICNPEMKDRVSEGGVCGLCSSVLSGCNFRSGDLSPTTPGL